MQKIKRDIPKLSQLVCEQIYTQANAKKFVYYGRLSPKAVIDLLDRVVAQARFVPQVTYQNVQEFGEWLKLVDPNLLLKAKNFQELGLSIRFLPLLSVLLKKSDRLCLDDNARFKRHLLKVGLGLEKYSLEAFNAGETKFFHWRDFDWKSFFAPIIKQISHRADLTLNFHMNKQPRLLKILADIILDAKQLKQLKLVNIWHLPDHFKLPPDLEILETSCSDIFFDQTGREKLLQEMSSLKKLRKLSLCCGSSSNASFDAIKVIENNPDLEELSLKGLLFLTYSPKLCRALQKCKRLRCLKMEFGNIHVSYIKDLFMLSSLKKLSLFHTELYYSTLEEKGCLADAFPLDSAKDLKLDTYVTPCLHAYGANEFYAAFLERHPYLLSLKLCVDKRLFEKLKKQMTFEEFEGRIAICN